MTTRESPHHATIIALPESSGIPIQGIYEALAIVGTIVGDHSDGHRPSFKVTTAGPIPGIHRNMYGLPIEVERSIDEIPDTDLVVIGSVIPPAGEWETGRYGSTVSWLREQHARGATLASACTAHSYWPRPAYSTTRRPPPIGPSRLPFAAPTQQSTSGLKSSSPAPAKMAGF